MTEVSHVKLEDILCTFEEVSAKPKTRVLTTAEQLMAKGMQQGAQQERIEIAKNMFHLI
ncbi:MAG: hypothetical protein AAFU83_03050 [Bacteroidota bacterium]